MRVFRAARVAAPRVVRRAALVGLAAIAMSACGDPPTGPTTGTIRVTVTTTGADLDTDGYTVSVDGAPADAVGMNASVTIDGLEPGTRAVRIEGLAGNCQVGGQHPRLTAVTAGETTNVTFLVTCVLRTGSIRVRTITTGGDPDLDGYTLAIDGLPAAGLGSNDRVVIPSVREGDRTLELGRLAANCAVGTPHPRVVQVTNGAVTEVTFTVTCVAVTGGVRVTTATTGIDLDPDGYQLLLDGVPYWSIPATGFLGIAGLAPGAYSLALGGVDANCAVDGANPRPVTIVVGATANVAFTLTCTSRTGKIRVTTVTTGADLDSDGYFVVVDDEYYPPVIDANGTITIDNVPIHTAKVYLTGVSPNRAVSGSSSPRDVPVFSGATSDVRFDVVCTALGRLHITSVTTGVDPDPNGYTLRVAGPAFDQTVTLATNGTVVIAVVAGGDHLVTLGGVAANCDITSQNPRTVAVGGGQAVQVAFDVTCAPVGQLAFANYVDGNHEIYLINSNGTGSVRLTTNPAFDAEPAWSPDGARIAFTSDRSGGRDIYVMNADGSSPVRLTTSPALDYQPTWSPDGTRIAFVSERDGNAEIYVMNADGSGAVRLTNRAGVDRDPDWSRDDKIAFSSGLAQSAQEIYVMNADGSGITRLTNNNEWDGQPAWSFDGTKLAFSQFAYCYYSDCFNNIVVMNRDGSGVVHFSSGTDDTDPAWSPDGRRIAFASRYCDYYYGCYNVGIFAVKPSGGDMTEIVGGQAVHPAWRP